LQATLAGSAPPGAWTAVSGKQLPRLVVLQGWASFAAREADLRAQADAASRLAQRCMREERTLLLGARRPSIAIFLA
jgi:hypothetical protein